MDFPEFRETMKNKVTQKISIHFSGSDPYHDALYWSFMFLTSADSRLNGLILLLLKSRIRWQKQIRVELASAYTAPSLSFISFHYRVFGDITAVYQKLLFTAFFPDTFCFTSWKQYRKQSHVAETENKAWELIPPSPGWTFDFGQSYRCFPKCGVEICWRAE